MVSPDVVFIGTDIRRAVDLLSHPRSQLVSVLGLWVVSGRWRLMMMLSATWALAVDVRSTAEEEIK